ncbi:MAG TPA: 3-oxoacyl-ACP reductase, partial [Myxococcales bacterium]|nr:3-oxoacyl-ACP reductase [Myxococcales bacterium]
MSDYLVEFAKNKLAQRAVKTLGLPIPMPPDLRRAEGANPELVLSEKRVLCGGAGQLRDQAAQCAQAAGATLVDSVQQEHIDALVFDASTITTPAELRHLYLFFHPRLARLSRHGRVVVLGRPPKAASTPLAATVQRSLSGFVKSLGKEIGRKGSTANLIWVDDGAEARLPGTLLFLLSRRACFVSGESLTVTKTARVQADSDLSASLRGKVALVTGAARGIGAAIARRLGQEGATLVLVDRPEGLAGLDELLNEFGGSQLALDLLEPDAIEQVVAHVAEVHGKIDIVINNAGITRDRTLAKMSEQWWDMCIGVNLDVACALTSALSAKVMSSQGRVIHISSIGGISGNPGQTNYATSKAGLIGHAQAAAPNLARRGITINCVAPGFIETAMTAAM